MYNNRYTGSKRLKGQENCLFQGKEKQCNQGKALFWFPIVLKLNDQKQFGDGRVYFNLYFHITVHQSVKSGQELMKPREIFLAITEI